MRRTLRAFAAGVAAVAAFGLAAAPASAAVLPHAAASGEPAYFVMTDISGEHFVVRMVDEEDIAHARDLVSGRTRAMPHVSGHIAKRREPWNRRWSFHIEPASVSFFELSIEVCDATIPYVEEHLDEVGGHFLPGGWWCDWSSRLIGELPEYSAGG